MERTFVISHGQDIDGVGSASLLRMRYLIDLKDMFFINYSQADFESALREVGRRLGKGSIVFFTDLSLNEKMVPMVDRFVRRVRARGGSVVWLDHHHWSDRALEVVARKCETAIVGENSCACATDIAKAYTRLTGEFVERFVGLVHCMDLYVDLEFASQPNPAWCRSASRIYSMGINYLGSGPFDAKQRKLRRVAGLISSGKFFDSSMREAARSYERMNKKRARALLAGMEAVSGRMAIGFSKEMDSGEGCRAMMGKASADIGVLVKTDSRSASIRSVESDISKLAMAFGGGGHPHAAGFEVPRKYDLSAAKGRRRLRDDLVSRSRRLGLID
jgi:oligoribonuclease NrnB/cAMP/cGMP phosphodiesterase (DHH superfamily)